jgi:beta-phosphoglucomutase-like phosphatase (HAD superfamily)
MRGPVDASTKAVFFDHDDTMVGTIRAKWAQHKYVAKTWYDIDLTDDVIRQHWGRPLSQLIAALYQTEEVELVMERMLSIHTRYPKELFPDTLPTLRSLRVGGKLLGVITATSRRSFEHDLDSLGVPRDTFDYTQTEEDTPFHKPDPRVFDPAIAWLADREVGPQEVLYVADGLHDREAALAAGFRFIGIERGLVPAEAFRALGTVAITSLNELVA